MIISAVVLYFFIAVVLLQGEAISIVAIIISLLAAAAITTLVDRYLKKNWPSNRALKIEDTTLATFHKETIEREINLSKQVNVLMWRFEVPRQTRVAKGWYVISCSLIQDDIHIPVYTFAPPEKFGDLEYVEHYTPLIKKKDLRKQQNDRSSLRLAGQQRRLHEAEEHRQLHGAELSNEQYDSYINFLITHYSQWMPNE